MILGVVLAVIGLAFCIIGMRGILPHSRCSKWPEVQGRIVEKELLSDDETSTMDHYSIKLSYTYVVGTKQYEGTTLFATDIGRKPGKLMKGDALTRIKQIQEEPVVHYDPVDPSRSFLLYGSITREMLILCSGAVLVLLGLVLLISEGIKLQWS